MWSRLGRLPDRPPGATHSARDHRRQRPDLCQPVRGHHVADNGPGCGVPRHAAYDHHHAYPDLSVYRPRHRHGRSGGISICRPGDWRCAARLATRSATPANASPVAPSMNELLISALGFVALLALILVRLPIAAVMAIVRVGGT